MLITPDDVKQLLQDDDPEAVLVLIEGRTEVISQRETDTPQYRGALHVVSRDELVTQIGGRELSDHDLAEQAARLDATISELGG
jgi:hypothetical protein